ncbi:hypothetical protein ONZ45_g17947 [Pleurotus djamor]|nr:hypothetical protein ONZ45_g17947 [Pleurotus djamor]
MANSPEDLATFPFDRFTKLKFMLDGVLDENEFVHEPQNTTDYDYNVTVFQRGPLEHTKHDFTIIILDPYSANKPVLMLFDSASYTIPDESEIEIPPPESPTSSSSQLATTETSLATPPRLPDASQKINIPAIIGGIIATVVNWIPVEEGGPTVHQAWPLRIPVKDIPKLSWIDYSTINAVLKLRVFWSHDRDTSPLQ